MDKYRYCSVQPKGMRTVYSYLSEEDILPDPFVGGLIEAAKEQIAKAEEVLDRETI